MTRGRLEEKIAKGVCPIHRENATYTRTYSKKDNYYTVYCSLCGGICDSYPGD